MAEAFARAERAPADWQAERVGPWRALQAAVAEALARAERAGAEWQAERVGP
jgi:hypothetical protein